MAQSQKGISTRWMLVAALVVVIGSVTASSLLIIRHRMQRQVLADFSTDLTNSVENFQSFESQRLAALERENALLADLPSLKALMTTSDQRTIADGAVQFWKVSDHDLFALATSDEAVLVSYTRGAAESEELRASLRQALAQPNHHFLLSGGRLFEYSVRPLYFGSKATGTLLGYVISGYAVDRIFLDQVNRASRAEITFLSNERVVTSTLDPAPSFSMGSRAENFLAGHPGPTTIQVGGQLYLAVSDDISPTALMPLRLVVMKSFRRAEQSQHEINLLLLLVGGFALLAGTLLMLAISGMVTAPLELLAKGVRAFGTGQNEVELPEQGTREVRELSIAFAAMREQIQQKNRALLESERLATIGRMASSVSHDLRHYLASVYANSEFLASSKLSDDERAELFADIRLAVHGTTELIDSLLIFSRANGAVRRVPELIANLLERAMALVRAHPEAVKVTLQAVYFDVNATGAVVDAKQMERAIYNLLLNACQAARASAGEPSVIAVIETSREKLAIRFTDTGLGVPEGIRASLFEPFVSEGKQNGTGLGLTLAHAVAVDHGGSVELVSSRPGETMFLLSFSRGGLDWDSADAHEPAEVTP